MPEPTPAIRRTLTRQLAIDDLINSLDEIVDPDLILERAGLERADLRKLETDDEISGALDMRLNAIKSMEWSLSYDSGNDNTELMDIIKPHIDSVIDGAFGAVPYGYAVQEIIYEEKEDSDIIGIKALHQKPLEWFRPTPSGALYLTKNGTVGEVELDTQFKFLLTRNKATYTNPFGQALLSRLYWVWFFRSSTWEMWMQFLERCGTPWVIGKGRDPAELISHLANIVQDSIVAIPIDSEIEFIEVDTDGEAFKIIEDTLVKRIQKRILGQTLTSDVGSSGSFAAAKVHDNVRMDVRNSDARLIELTVNNLLAAVCGINDWETPTFKLQDGKGLQGERAERDKLLADSGVTFSEQYVTKAYGFANGDVTITDTATSASASFALSDDAITFGQSALTQKNISTVDAVITGAVKNASTPIDKAVLLAAIADAKDEHDLAQRFADILSENPSPENMEILERLMFAADVLGFGDA